MPIIQDLLDSLDKMKAIHKSKNDDYASTDNPFSNFDVSEYGLRLFTNPRDQSFVWPIFTKLARLSTLLNNRSIPNNESVEDSMLDIAIYVLLWKADLVRRRSIDPNNSKEIKGCKFCGNTLKGNPKLEFCDGDCEVRYNVYIGMRGRRT